MQRKLDQDEEGGGVGVHLPLIGSFIHLGDPHGDHHGGHSGDHHGHSGDHHHGGHFGFSFGDHGHQGDHHGGHSGDHYGGFGDHHRGDQLPPRPHSDFRYWGQPGDLASSD